MELKQLRQFCQDESVRLSETYLRGYDQEKLSLHALAKLTEEVGELSDAVLTKLGAQRGVKTAGYNDSNLEEEIADVIIVTGIIGHLTGMDLEKALESKMKKIENRYHEEEANV